MLKRVLLLICIFTSSLFSQPIPSEPYTFKPVVITGGGFVDGIIFHPTEKNLRYARTDMGGAYRWDEPAKRWTPILDFASYEDTNLMGVESIATDPQDPDRVYLACGTYTNPTTPNAFMLRSRDRGKTFERTQMPFKMGGNEDGRGNGERLAVDPSDGNILYFGSRHSGLWKSTDAAVTWSRVTSFPNVTEATSRPASSPSPGTPGEGRGEGRGEGSTRAATTQSARRGFGFAPRSSGIIFVDFLPSLSPSGGEGQGEGVSAAERAGERGQPAERAHTPSQTIYVGVSLINRPNLFRSTDAGETWQPVENSPTAYRPNHASLASDNTLYISYGSAPGPSRMRDGAIWKLNTKTGDWTNITPEKPTTDNPFGYGAVSVDAHDPKVLIASTFNHPNGEEIFRSTNAGQSWTPIFHGPDESARGKLDHTLAPYTARTPIHWLLDIEINPTNPNHALFTTGYGGYETFNLTDADNHKPTTWSIMSTGIEETVALDLLSPPPISPPRISPSPGTPGEGRGEGSSDQPASPHLITAIGDYGGFVHWDLDSPASEGNFDNPHFGNTTSIACAEFQPTTLVRVGRGSGNRGGGNIAYSLDSGKTWQPTQSTPQPNSTLGHIAVSVDGQTWIWTPQNQLPHVTRDQGKNWDATKGLPTNTRVIADRVNANKFYAMDLFNGKLFTSEDAGGTFSEHPLNLPGGHPARADANSNNNTNRGDNRGGQDKLYATPSKEGDLYLAAFEALYHSPDAGKTFTKLPKIKELHAFGFGATAHIAPSPGTPGEGRDEGPPPSPATAGEGRGEGLPPSPPAGERAGERGLPEVRSQPAHPTSETPTPPAVSAVEPTLYLIGVIQSTRGIFRSTDAGQSWTRINDDAHQYGLLLQITGDPKQFGRVYIGTHGRGIVYGDPPAAAR